MEPSYEQSPDRDALLYQTYRNALLAIDDNTAATCAAVASISTGRLRFPVTIAATISLRALRDVCFDRDFEAKVAFVCFERPVLKSFECTRTELLRAVDDASFVAPQ
ncbi:Macro domain-containing protein [Globisporangium polare]